MSDQDRRQMVVNLQGLATALGGAALRAAQFATDAIPESAQAASAAPACKVAEVGIEALKAASEAAAVTNTLTLAAVEAAMRLELSATLSESLYRCADWIQERDKEFADRLREDAGRLEGVVP